LEEVTVEFKIGQKVVYPNHGVGVIEGICTRDVGNGSPGHFYQLRLVAGGSVVMVPVDNVMEVGLRAPLSANQCQRLMDLLSDDFPEPASNWKDRYKEYLERMQTGDAFEVAYVLKTLAYLNHLKPLSFREKRLFEKARFLIVSELAAATRKSEGHIDPKIDMALQNACQKHLSGNGTVRAMAAAT
jgi:CarD family transcriptional regulator